MSVKGVQDVAPRLLPSPGQVDYDRLKIPEGPWNESFWVLMPHAGRVRSGSPQNCRVSTCERPAFYFIKSPDLVKETLCYAHYFQWVGDGRSDDVVEWSTTRAREPVHRERGRRNCDRGIDFSSLPDSLATEIRFAAGSKIARGDWTSNWQTRDFLERLIDTAMIHGAASFLEHDLASWEEFLERQWKRRDFLHSGRPYLRTFYSTLTRGLVDDPWAEDRWLWKGCFDALLAKLEGAVDRPNLRWDLIRTDWLRVSSKQLAKSMLIAGARKWSTMIDWTRALRSLDEYLVQEGIAEPQFLDREVFLDFLAWVRECKGSKHSLVGVNTVASILEMLRADQIVPTLGAAVYLRRGENAIRKARNPRPYPQDIINKIDEILIPDPDLDRTIRTMLRLARWSGPRVSELVSMPVDILRHNANGGYWVEYWMSKTETWRRFPVPDDLAEEIRQQQEAVRLAFGTGAQHLFPGGRSNRGDPRTRPWSVGGFRGHIRALFMKHEIAKSAITGEVVTGGETHRFRHTVGTTLLNNNWTQPEVQEFLGHLSATMTSFYAKITDETMARKAEEFHRQQNENAAKARFDPKVERLRQKFSAALPNGGCRLPPSMNCDFRPNPCLECSFFEPVGEGVEEPTKRIAPA